MYFEMQLKEFGCFGIGELFGFSAEVKIGQGNQRGTDNQQKGDGIDHRSAAVSDLKIQIDG